MRCTSRAAEKENRSPENGERFSGERFSISTAREVQRIYFAHIRSYHKINFFKMEKKKATGSYNRKRLL